MRTLLAALLLVAVPAGQTLAGETIYQYRDAKGVIHLSNRKLDDKFQPFDYMRLPAGTDQAKVYPFIRYYCRRHGLDPELVRAMVEVESGFAVAAVSPKGAAGLMQLMPATQATYGVADPFDPERNVATGAKFLQSLLSRFGDLSLALAAYNAGPETVARCGGIPNIPETRNYVSRILTRYAMLKEDHPGLAPKKNIVAAKAKKKGKGKAK